MDAPKLAQWMLAQETRALLTRLARVKPFALVEPMVPAAAFSPAAQTAIETYLATGRRELRNLAHSYLRWLQTPVGQTATPSEAQRRFTFLRLRFNAMLSQFDIFSDALTQRSEHENGVWLAGLDVVAADALALSGNYYTAPPVVCYLDRGHGAAIRRARTRLPGGGENPVALIRVPRERMVGSGIASSLIHEVGHQAAALLDLVNSLRPVLHARQRSEDGRQLAWQLWERWLGEIVSDLWAVAQVGCAATVGLMGVVSLPRFFVFRAALDAPHPVPWIRVLLSSAMGAELFPHPQWQMLAALWEAYYPLGDLEADRRKLFADLRATMPAFVRLLVNHRPQALRGRSLREVFALEERRPERLAALYTAWNGQAAVMRSASPTLVFAVIGQAKIEGKISPEAESRLLAELLTHWALQSVLDVTARTAAPSPIPSRTHKLAHTPTLMLFESGGRHGES